ncbi:MAG: type I-E CRISPR-associated protein Cse1/CasA [Candidatus Limiplasma sp.]|nr:type I-E CRISPR-associated protein Cse1/CasA [Candidatus Limiplasma sp.]
MADREFNLLHEPWIRAMRPDSSVEELSLTDALLRAHEYGSLAGELPTQDIAVLRLMLAVLHAVFHRVDEDGNEAPLEDDVMALDRWEALWRMRRVPAAPVCDYLNRYEDRFWLFHPERPFYQAVSAIQGSGYGAEKLNGAINESGNKPRLFASRAGEAKKRLTYAEAARWLFQLNGFDDAGLKKKIRTDADLPSFKTGWLGQLGLIAANGRNLFETLMLNLVLLDKSDAPWDAASPEWEKPAPDLRDRVWIAAPHDQAALLTLQSRRTLLLRENGYVVGYHVLSGEQFSPENAFSEQMTLWRKTKEGKYLPRKHSLDKALWREMAALFTLEDKDCRPGVVRWNQQVLGECGRVLPAGYRIRYQAASVWYSGGSIPSALDEVYADELSFHMNLLSHLGDGWISKMNDEVERVERLAQAVGFLADTICKAAGGSGSGGRDRACEQFFYRVDEPFRRWLMTLDADQTDVEQNERQCVWRREAGRIARELGREWVERAGTAAFAGRAVKVKEGAKEKAYFYSAPDAYDRFLKRVKKILGGGNANGEP